jgi:L-threonylcarbamoyladenylate synthase
MILIVLVFTVFGAQVVMATETGTTTDGFKWMYEEGTMAMCYNGEGKSLNVPYIEYGEEYDDKEKARKLFSSLRRFDKMGAKKVYVRTPEAKGVGLAVYNRLIRAAGFEVIDLE